MIQPKQRIEIGLSKTKIVLILMSSLAFTAAGFWFVSEPAIISHSAFGNPILISIIGIAAIIFLKVALFMQYES